MEFSDVQGWLGAAKDTVVLLKSAATLMPKGEKKAEIEGKIGDAERALKESDARLAKDLGYPLCQCTLPPQVMLWKEAQKAHVCPNAECGRVKPHKMGLARQALEQSGQLSSTGWMAR